MNQDKIDNIRDNAFDLLATWMDRWERATTKEPTGKDGILTDLHQYSPTSFDEVRQGHDHHLLIFHPSVGDEAGYWTLYVTTEHDPRDQLNPPAITSITQVFDTAPNPIYFDEDGDGTKAKWYYTPTDQGYKE